LAERQYRCEPETAWQGWPGKAAPDLSRQSLPQQPLPLYLVRPETLTAQSFWLQVERLDLESAVEKQIVCRLRDITAEKALQTSSATFNAFVSHKLRTPLTSVISSLDVVRLSIAAQDYQGVAEMVEYALQGARRLGNEITDVLNYLYATAESSSESGCVLARLRELAERLSAELGLKMVAIELPAPLEKRLIPLSMSALEIVLREILENSLKFHPRHTPQIKMTAQPQEERVCLRFMDDGIHLAPQQLAHAWTPYHQGEKYFTGEMAGMGLGLSLVANLVWSAGGKTRIHNRADQPGVVVELELPLLPESRTPELVI
jgi:K+-sensing histidine kinase KdpD